MNYCSSCGFKASEEDRFCSACGKSLKFEDNSIKLEVVKCSDDDSAHVRQEVMELSLPFNQKVCFNEEKIYIEYSNDLAGKYLELLSSFKPIDYRDIKNVESKSSGWFTPARLSIELNNGKLISLGYSVNFNNENEREESVNKLIEFINKQRALNLSANTSDISKLDDAPESIKKSSWFERSDWLGTNQEKLMVTGVLALILVIFIMKDKNNSPSSVDSVANTITPYSKLDICKGVISSVAGQPVNIMTAIQRGEKITVVYNRPSDNKRWEYRCKLIGSKGVWATPTGRWRTHAMDSKLTFKVANNVLYIKEIYSDGSMREKKFWPNSF